MRLRRATAGSRGRIIARRVTHPLRSQLPTGWHAGHCARHPLPPDDVEAGAVGVIAAPAAREARPRGVALPRWLVDERVVSLVLVAAVACLLRLPLPDLTPFGHDEALEAARARPIWFGARPVDSEVTSWWIPDPAGLLYYFSLAEAFARPAVARVVLVALANVAAVLVTYGLARRFFGPRVALAAGLLYAANPWAVTFGRQPWVITQPLLTAIMLLAALMVVAKRDRRWIVPFFITGAAQTQTHLLAVLYGPPVLLTLVLFWRRWLAPQLVPAVGAGLLIVAPYALHLWAIRDEVIAALDRGNRGVTLVPDPTAAIQTFWLISGLQLDAKLGVPDAALTLLRGPLLAVALIAGLLLVAGVALAARACARRAPGWEAYALALIWFLAPLALMTWQSSQVYVHYVLVLLPAPFVLMALPIGAGWQRAGHAARRTVVGMLATGALALTVVVHVASVALFYAALERSLAAPRSETTPTEYQAALNRVELGNKQLGLGELHGLPLRYWQAVADRTRDAARANGVREVVVVTGILDDANRHLDRRRKALDYLLGPDLAPRFPLEGLTVLPSGGDTIILALPEHDLPRGAGRGAARVVDEPLPGTNGATRGWLVRARPARELVTPRVHADASFANGVRLLGADVPSRAAPGQTIPVATYWLVERDAAPEGEDVAPSVDLLGVDGTVRGAVRRGGLPSGEWRSGDVLVQRAALTVPVSLPPGEYRVAAGLAPRGEGGRVPLGDPSGGDRLVVSTLSVRPNP